MKKTLKYSIFAGIFVCLLAMKVGVLEGSADHVYMAPNPDTTIAYAALISERPVAFTKITPPVLITAYSSRPEETDDTPFITASGTHVRDGVVAANWLPIGTKIRIPSLYGDKVFVVEDRMARKNSHKLDIWFPTTRGALIFGVKYARIEIL